MIFGVLDLCPSQRYHSRPVSNSWGEFIDGAPSPCNSHNGGRSPGLRVFHPSETSWTRARTPTYSPNFESLSRRRNAFSRALHGCPRPPESTLARCRAGSPRRRLQGTEFSTPGLGANSQVPPLTGAALTCVFLHSPSTGATGPIPSAPPSDLFILRVIVDFGHFLPEVKLN